MSQRPIVIGLHLCEQIIVDEKSGNITPVNCFTKRMIDGSLKEKQSFNAFAALADGHGLIQGLLELERLETGETIYRKRFSVRFENPLQRWYCLLKLRQVRFPATGGYQVMLTIMDEIVATHRFTVHVQE